MRALVIGSGSSGQRHMHNLQVLVPHVEFILLRSGLGWSQPAIRHETVERLIDALALEPDIALVCTPSATHAEALVPLLEKGVPVYVEKPLVTTIKDVERIGSMLPTFPTTVGCNLRFLPALQQARDAIAEIGRVVRASFTVGQWLPDWRPNQDYRDCYSANPGDGGGVIFDLIHELDVSQWLLGSLEVRASEAAKLSRLEISSEDTACIVLRRRDEPAAIVTVSMDYVSRQPTRTYEIVGDNGTMRCDLIAQHVWIDHHAGSTTITRDPGDFDMEATYVAAMRELVEAVRRGGSTSYSIADSIPSTLLALRARELAELPPTS